MKNILFVFGIVLLFSCENNKSTTETSTAKDSVTTTTDKTPKPKGLKEIVPDLETLTPLDEETLKSKLPAELFGTERSSVETSSSTGALAADATYQLDDSTSIDISILDCGGPAGSGFFNLNYVNAVENGLSVDHAVITKSEYMGYPAFELVMKDEPSSGHDRSFTFFNGTRFLVNLNGENVTMEKLKEAAGKIKF